MKIVKEVARIDIVVHVVGLALIGSTIDAKRKHNFTTMDSQWEIRQRHSSKTRWQLLDRLSWYSVLVSKIERIREQRTYNP